MGTTNNTAVIKWVFRNKDNPNDIISEAQFEDMFDRGDERAKNYEGVRARIRQQYPQQSEEDHLYKGANLNEVTVTPNGTYKSDVKNLPTLETTNTSTYDDVRKRFKASVEQQRRQAAPSAQEQLQRHQEAIANMPDDKRREWEQDKQFAKYVRNFAGAVIATPIITEMALPSTPYMLRGLKYLQPSTWIDPIVQALGTTELGATSFSAAGASTLPGALANIGLSSYFAAEGANDLIFNRNKTWKDWANDALLIGGAGTEVALGNPTVAATIEKGISKAGLAINSGVQATEEAWNSTKQIFESLRNAFNKKDWNQVNSMLFNFGRELKTNSANTLRHVIGGENYAKLKKLDPTRLAKFEEYYNKELYPIFKEAYLKNRQEGLEGMDRIDKLVQRTQERLSGIWQHITPQHGSHYGIMNVEKAKNEDIKKFLDKYYPGISQHIMETDDGRLLYQTEGSQISGFIGGKGEVPVFGYDITAKSVPYQIDVPETGIWKDIRSQEVIGGISENTPVNLPKEYTEALDAFADAVSEHFKGSKIFGSSKLITKAGFPKSAHDIDLIMCNEDVQRIPEIRNAKFKTPFTKEVILEPVNGESRYGRDMGSIDINVIEMHPDGTGNKLAQELYRQFFPTEYNEMAWKAHGQGIPLSEMPLTINGRPITERELLDVYDPVTKSIMDALEADFKASPEKAKYKPRIFQMIKWAEPKAVSKGLKQYARSILGTDYKELPDFTKAFGDASQNKKLLKAMGYNFDVSNSPERMQNAMELWYMDMTSRFRGVDPGRLIGNGTLEEKLKNAFNIWAAVGGNAYGGGLNTVGGMTFSGAGSIGAFIQLPVDFSKATTPEKFMQVVKRSVGAHDYVFTAEDLANMPLVSKYIKEGNTAVDLLKAIPEGRNAKEVAETTAVFDELKANGIYALTREEEYSEGGRYSSIANNIPANWHIVPNDDSKFHPRSLLDRQRMTTTYEDIKRDIPYPNTNSAHNIGIPDNYMSVFGASGNEYNLGLDTRSTANWVASLFGRSNTAQDQRFRQISKLRKSLLDKFQQYNNDVLAPQSRQYYVQAYGSADNLPDNFTHSTHSLGSPSYGTLEKYAPLGWSPRLNSTTHTVKTPAEAVGRINKLILEQDYFRDDLTRKILRSLIYTGTGSLIGMGVYKGINLLKNKFKYPSLLSEKTLQQRLEEIQQQKEVLTKQLNIDESRIGSRAAELHSNVGDLLRTLESEEASIQQELDKRAEGLKKRRSHRKSAKHAYGGTLLQYIQN